MLKFSLCEWLHFKVSEVSLGLWTILYSYDPNPTALNMSEYYKQEKYIPQINFFLESCHIPHYYHSQRLTTSFAPRFVKKSSAETIALPCSSPDPATNTHVSGHTQESFSLVTTNLCSATQSRIGFFTEGRVCEWVCVCSLVNLMRLNKE